MNTHKENTMKKRTILLILAAVLASSAVTTAQEYPMLDPVANKVIQKYQTSTCQQLAEDKAAPLNDMQKRAVTMMRQDPKLRSAFIKKVAVPIANKLFECGMIP
jgi:hypothetical protein